MDKVNTVLLLLLLTLCGWFQFQQSEMKAQLTAVQDQLAQLQSGALSGNSPNAAPQGLRPPGAMEVPKGNVPVASMQLEKKEHHFGRIKAGDKVKTLFTFRNTSEVPLVISNAVGSCGCTVPKYPTTPIAAGEEGAIEVEFDSSGKQGEQTKTVTITANTNPPTSILTIKATVVPVNQ